MFNYAVEPRRLLDTRLFRQFLRSRLVAALQAARYFVDKGELAETTDGSSATDPRTSRALHPTQVHLRTQMDAGQRGDLGPRAPLLRAICDYRLPQRGLLHRVTMESRDDVSRESTADWQPSYFW